MRAIRTTPAASVRGMARVAIRSFFAWHHVDATCNRDTCRQDTSIVWRFSRRAPHFGGGMTGYPPAATEGRIPPARSEDLFFGSLASRASPSFAPASRCLRGAGADLGHNHNLSATSAKFGAVQVIWRESFVTAGGGLDPSAMPIERDCLVRGRGALLGGGKQHAESSARSTASLTSINEVATSAATSIAEGATSASRPIEETATSSSSLKENAVSSLFTQGSDTSAPDADGDRYFTASRSSCDSEVVIALGSNVGDRVENFKTALRRMREAGIHIVRHGCLYESAPAYVEDQPFFLNSAVSAHTDLSPRELLHELKAIEKEMGRDLNGRRFGPRPLDLDIIFYGNQSIMIDAGHLVVPHPRLLERSFVVAPMLDLLGTESGGASGNHWSRHPILGGGLSKHWQQMGGESTVGDGGQFFSLQSAIAQARKMALEGASIIDVGGQSTRPGAARVSVQEELARVIPVTQALASDPDLNGIALSIDTFYAKVAEDAVSAGAHIVNDVSAGTLDPKMIPTVARLGVPYVMMHMRGEPQTMQRKEYTSYEDICRDVSCELLEQARKAEEAGIPVWNIILDPGIGFAKTGAQSLQLLRDLPRFRSLIAEGSQALGHAPILVGVSRKGFLGRICNRHAPEDRDYASAAITAAAVSGGANIVRGHNVTATLDGARIGDAIGRWNSSSSQLP
ncbi:hypothetical protein CBR_g61480 [Chara braunii]|uniref:Pterin-binding domain-containing protein n=1 Tax=Chara braunii TaxID=69332 RepID=A0A388K8Q0_CHABU|nr:hypothetical protein CBR_g61480 [Chara braunii]|eukprot:GBG66437.1 hypothetical protein CBR_g61480 [Chara braunii]